MQSPKALLGVRHPVGWNRPPMCSHRRHCWVAGIQLVGTGHPCAVTEGTIGCQASSWLEQATHVQSPKALLGVRHPVGWNRPPMCSHRRHYWVSGIQLVGTDHPCAVTKGTIGCQASSWLEQATHIQSLKALLGGRHPVGWNRPPMCSHRRHCWVAGIQLVGTGHPYTVTEGTVGRQASSWLEQATIYSH